MQHGELQRCVSPLPWRGLGINRLSVDAFRRPEPEGIFTVARLRYTLATLASLPPDEALRPLRLHAPVFENALRLPKPGRVRFHFGDAK